MEIILKWSLANVKKPKHLKKNVFILYSPRTVKIEPATSKRIDTEIIVSLPKNSKGFVTSIFRRDEINEFNSEQQQLWVEILNKSYEETVEIKKKNNPLGSVIIEPEHLKFKHGTETTKNKKKEGLIIENHDVQTEEARGNVVVFLTVMTLPMLAETLLIKQQRLPLALSKLLQTTSTRLQSNRSIKLFQKVVQKWRECFPKYWKEPSKISTGHHSGC